jgi:hypothetical protein
VPISTDPNNHVDPQDNSPPSPSSTHVSDSLPTPPLEYANPIIVSSTAPTFDAFPFPRGHDYSTSEHLSSHAPGPYPPYFLPHPHSRPPPVLVPSHYPYHLINRPIPAVFSRPDSTTPSPPIHPSFPLGVPSEHKELATRKLQAGDMLYWHHLAKHGEIPGVEEDERARGNSKPTACGGKRSAAFTFDR